MFFLVETFIILSIDTYLILALFIQAILPCFELLRLNVLFVVFLLIDLNQLFITHFYAYLHPTAIK